MVIAQQRTEVWVDVYALAGMLLVVSAGKGASSLPEQQVLRTDRHCCQRTLVSEPTLDSWYRPGSNGCIDHIQRFSPQ